MKSKMRHILKSLIYELNQKVTILSEDGVMNIFNCVDIYNTIFYVNNICGSYINKFL